MTLGEVKTLFLSLLDTQKPRRCVACGAFVISKETQETIAYGSSSSPLLYGLGALRGTAGNTIKCVYP